MWHKLGHGAGRVKRGQGLGDGALLGYTGELGKPAGEVPESLHCAISRAGFMTKKDQGLLRKP
jgi:hypothetical protein